MTIKESLRDKIEKNWVLNSALSILKKSRRDTIIVNCQFAVAVKQQFFASFPKPVTVWKYIVLPIMGGTILSELLIFLRVLHFKKTMIE